MDHLINSKFLTSRQFGFIKDRNVSDAVYEVVIRLQKSLDRGSTAAALLIDVKKAFDFVSITLLKRLLFNAGIRGVPLEWI